MMSDLKKEWKVVDGHYPGFLSIIGAAYPVSIVTTAADLSFEDFVNRTNDAHLMAAAPDLLEALEMALDALAHCRADIGYSSMQTRAAHMADKVIKKARNQQ